MSPANVYRFFPSKSAITEAICGRIIGDHEGELAAIVHGPGTASGRLTMFIEAMARHTLERLLEEKKVHDLVVAAMEEHWGVIERHIQTSAAMVAEIIASGVATGEFKPVDIAFAARCVHCSLAALKHPVLVAQCRDDPFVPSPAEMACFLVAALKA